MTLAPLLARAIERLSTGESMSDLFYKKLSRNVGPVMSNLSD
jgi:hypothetical protein